MRIYFSAMTLPKKAAKRIKDYFSLTENSLVSAPMPLHQAQSITAYLLGYDDWHELEKITKSGAFSPSLTDEHACAAEQAERITFQAERLGAFISVTVPLLRELVHKFRVSASSPNSPSFSFDAYRKNTLLFWEPVGGVPEWRFCPSGRSKEMREVLYELTETWSRGQISLTEYVDQLNSIIEEQPENVVPYLYILEACSRIGAWEEAVPYLAKLEAAIEGTIPNDYPMKKKVPSLVWGTIENRDYLRSIYFLAQGYYAIQEYKKAKRWFLFLTRCSQIELGFERLFLKDLRQTEPAGDVHLD